MLPSLFLEELVGYEMDKIRLLAFLLGRQDRKKGLSETSGGQAACRLKRATLHRSPHVTSLGAVTTMRVSCSNAKLGIFH